jgi:radical SAM protein with 4Fe4S-binding SPASM domain
LKANQPYRLPADLVIKKKKGKFLFLSPSQPAWVVSNANGALALSLCNGKRSQEEIAGLVSRRAGHDVSAEIDAFFQRVGQTTRLLAPTAPDPAPPPARLRVVHLNLTERCNLNCVYCYADSRSRGGRPLDLGEYKRFIDQIGSLAGGVQIVFTGGEPLLHEEVFTLASYARQQGHELHLLTNGTLIDDNNISRICELFDLVKISLDGSNAKSHDIQRGSGTFERTLAAFEMLRAKHTDVQLAMTVTKSNLADVPRAAEMFGSRLSFAPMFPAGRGRDHRKQCVSGKEYYKALSASEHVAPLGRLCSTLAAAGESKICKCAMAEAEISLSPQGEVYPCHLLHLPRFVAGSIRQHSLAKIWEDSPVLKKCRQLTVDRIAKCKTCEIRYICGGACRARAFFEMGSIEMAGDFCQYEKLAYLNGLFDSHHFEH